MNTVLEKIRSYGVVPVIAIEDATQAPALGAALLQGGLPCAEVTFRTAAAEAAIASLAAAHPDLLVGAGTVLTTRQAEQAVGAGAQFVVSPGLDPQIVTWCLEREVPVTPGVATPTEIHRALGLGLQVLKFFPAEALGGVKMLKAIGGPFGEVRFIPTGGINAANLASYLALPLVHACGGSWLVKRDLIMAGEFEQIAELAGAARQIVRAVRGEG